MKLSELADQKKFDKLKEAILKQEAVQFVCVCGFPLRVSNRIPAEKYPFQINGNPAHEDCWYQRVGEEVETHPIRSPIPLKFV